MKKRTQPPLCLMHWSGFNHMRPNSEQASRGVELVIWTSLPGCEHSQLLLGYQTWNKCHYFIFIFSKYIYVYVPHSPLTSTKKFHWVRNLDILFYFILIHSGLPRRNSREIFQIWMTSKIMYMKLYFKTI